jgi:hypothetical protein
VHGGVSTTGAGGKVGSCSGVDLEMREGEKMAPQDQKGRDLNRRGGSPRGALRRRRGDGTRWLQRPRCGGVGLASSSLTQGVACAQDRADREDDCHRRCGRNKGEVWRRQLTEDGELGWQGKNVGHYASALIGLLAGGKLGRDPVGS